MREIKFRVWDKIGNSFIKSCGHCIRFDTSAADILGHQFSGHVKDYTIQQYTGLKDKNGKEIYEGDIVKETTSKGPNLPERFKNYVLKDNEKQKIEKIQWGKYADGEYSDSVECWMFGEDNSLSELISRTKGSYHEWVREYEVIGNIFENPELLEKSKQ